ncbi:MAG: DUF6036 family nucleotidyltransferase [Candidatus Edwardsbacteria bacterium]
MNHSQLEHIIRAAGSISGDSEIIIIGSQAVLAQFPDAPRVLLQSMEVDLFPKNKPELSDLIDGSIGELSRFHQRFGYYAHGVGKKTAILPEGWEERLIPIKNPNTKGITGWCLEVHDLVLSKYVAARERDIRFNEEVIRHRMVRQDTLLKRVETLRLRRLQKKSIIQRIKDDFARIREIGAKKR